MLSTSFLFAAALFVLLLVFFAYLPDLRSSIVLCGNDGTRLWYATAVHSPAEQQVYSFSFTIYNTTGENETFDLTADAFTGARERSGVNRKSCK